MSLWILILIVIISLVILSFLPRRISGIISLGIGGIAGFIAASLFIKCNILRTCIPESAGLGGIGIAIVYVVLMVISSIIAAIFIIFGLIRLLKK